jgi:xanthine dehydrogenase YagT iron-sulfur-binding subunit
LQGQQEMDDAQIGSQSNGAFRPMSERMLTVKVNGRTSEHMVPSQMTLAEFIRDRLGLMGTKIACDQAACGACTVLVDGFPIFACHTLAAQLDGAEVLTIEGLEDGKGLHPLQTAFITHDALQCGFCTPGMIMALMSAIREGASDRSSLAHSISGNICRCGAYEHILDAALSVVAS